MATARSSDSQDLFTALSHPLRRQILRAMAEDEGESSPRELAVRLDQPLSKLSYHVRVLAQSGAVELVRTKQVRGSTQHFYHSVVEAPWAKTALQPSNEPPPKGKSQGEEIA